MEALGAVADECEAVRRTVGIFLGMTTMIYTHVMNRPGVVARSPHDVLAARWYSGRHRN
jgi:hypothetical protein